MIVDFLNVAILSVEGIQDLQEIFVDLAIAVETLLDLLNIVSGVIELGLLFLLDRLVGFDFVQFDFVAGRQEGIEAINERAMASEKLLYAGNDARRINMLGFEILHDVEELIVDARLFGELQFDLIKEI